MKPLYIVSVRTNRPSLILDVLDGGCELIGVWPDAEAPTTAKKAMHYIGNKRNKGIKGVDLVIETINASPTPAVHVNAVKRAFKTRGFADSSHQAAISTLLKEKKIVDIGGRNYQLAPVLKKVG